MTTHQPPPAVESLPSTDTKDPYPNKAITTAVLALVTAGLQWVTTGNLNFEGEGITAIGGAVAAIVVYFVSNWKRKGF